MWQKYWWYFFSSITLLLCVWSYHPGLSGFFIFDDYGNVYKNEFLKISQFTFTDLWQASVSNESGPLKRPISMLSFALNHLFTEMDPWWMKLTNLCIHLANGLLVFLVLRLVFARLAVNGLALTSKMAAVVTLVWLVHPINVTAVSYIVQRMTSLSASFVLLALYCYLKLREGNLPAWRSYAASGLMLLFWLLGLLSKETAILLSVYVFTLEWCVYRFRADSTGQKRHLGVLWCLLGLPWVLAPIYILIDPSRIIAGYAYRDFTLVERLLTESRIVMDYLRLIIIPDIGQMGLFHDDVHTSTSLTSPLSTLFSILLIAGLLGSAIIYFRRLPLYSLGLMWFFGGHVLESTIYPLELVFLHRNYLPSLGLLLVLLEAGMWFMQRYSRGVVVMSCVVVIGLSLCTRSLAYQWSDDSRMLLVHAINNPSSVRANILAGQVYSDHALSSPSEQKKQEYKLASIQYFKKIREIDELNAFGELSVLALYLSLHEKPPEALTKNILSLLPAAKSNLALINLITSIEICLINKQCVLHDDEFKKIMQALLANPTLLKTQRAQILRDFSAYIYYYEGNLEEAIKMAKKAIEMQPDMLQLYPTLLFYFQVAGDNEGVRDIIQTLASKDTLMRYKKYTGQSFDKVNVSIDKSIVH